MSSKQGPSNKTRGQRAIIQRDGSPCALAICNESPLYQSPIAPHDRRAGFAVGPILYILMLAGVAAGVLFSSYSQILRTNIGVTNTSIVKSDLQAAVTTLSATAALDGTTQLVFCPPGGSGMSADCAATTPVKLMAFAEVPPADAARLPSNYADVSSSGAPMEVGVPKAGSGLKQLDPWGHYYVYCRWENARSDPASPALALISAGSNATIETNCDGTGTKGDDQYVFLDVGAAIQRAAVWQTTESGSNSNVEYGSTGTKVIIRDDGTIEAINLILSGTATLSNMNLTSPLPVTSGGTGSGNAIGARANLGSGNVGDALFVATTTNAAQTAIGATNLGKYLLSSATLVAETASGVRQTLLGSGVTGDALFTSDSAAGARGILGATTMGHYLFSSSTYDDPTATDVRTTLLGASSIGNAVFTAGDTNTALSALGGTSVGIDVFTAASASAARTALGGGTIGSALFTSVTQAQAWAILGLTGTSIPPLDIDISGNASNVTGIVTIAHGGTSASTASGALDNLFNGDGGPGGGALNVNRIAGNSLDSSKLTNVVAAGSYNLVTVDSAGRVTSGATVSSESDHITDGSGESIVATATNGGELRFATDGTTWMTLNALGYLGLNIANPAERLHVNSGNIRVSAPAGTSRQLQFTTSTADKRWVVATDGAAEGGASTGSDFKIDRYTDAGAAVNALTISRATGNALFAGQVAATGGFLGVFTGTFDGTFTGTVAGNLALGPTAANTNPQRAGDVTTGLYSDAAGVVGISSGGTPRLYVTATGSVGIGTVTPSHTLTVSGDIALSSIANALYIAGTKILHQPASDATSIGLGPFTLSSQSAANLYNTALGREALFTNTSGNFNTAVGAFALTSNATGGSNSALGYQALNSNATGNYNAAFGRSALFYNATGSNNSALGAESLYSNVSGSNNSALGFSALKNNTTGSNNTVVGYQVGSRIISSGSSNILIGTSSAVDTPAAATNNFLNIGNLIYGDMAGVRIGIGNPTIWAGASLDVSSRTDSIIVPKGTTAQRPGPGLDVVGMTRYNTDTNVFEFYQGGGTPTWTSFLSSSSTFGSGVILGTSATLTNPSRSDDVTTGLFSDTASTVSIATAGTERLRVTATGATLTGDLNLSALTNALYVAGTKILSLPGGDATSIAVGTEALAGHAGGARYNVAVGLSALKANTTGAGNSAVGFEALTTNLTGSENAAFGSSALSNNSTGSYNAAFGTYALVLNTVGQNNAAFGQAALRSNTAGSENSAFGSSALYSTTTGNNAAFGASALYYNSTGTNNAAFGPYALFYSATGSNNTAFGDHSLHRAKGSNNTAFGQQAGGKTGGGITTGSNNTVLGYSVGSTTLSTGSSNILIGTSSDVDTPAAATSNYLNIGNTVFGDLTTGRVLLQGGATVSANTPRAGTVLDLGYASGAGYSSIILPQDSTANRPASPVVGMVRYNTTTNALESYQGSTATWISLLSSSSTFGSGVILGTSATLTNPSRSDDVTTGLFSDTASTVSIATAGTERLRVTATGATLTGDLNLSALTNVLSIAGTAILRHPAGASTSLGIGRGSLETQTGTASYNYAFGFRALRTGAATDMNAGSFNNAIGYNALYTNTASGTSAGARNNAIGASALYTNTASGSFAGANNNAIGQSVLYINTGIGNYAGAYNNAIGGSALSSNIANGANAGSYNNAIGPNALQSNTATGAQAGSWNNAIGYSALFTNTSSGLNAGAYNNAIGFGALYANKGTGDEAGSYNNAIGYSALNNNTGSGNTAIGSYALGSQTATITGSRNVALGWGVGQTGLTSGSDNILIGTSSTVTTPTTSTSNFLNIGNTIFGDLTTGRVLLQGGATVSANTPNAGTILDLGYATGTAYSSIILPKDTSSNRPTTGVAGMLRYNTTTNTFEGYNGTAWGSLAGGTAAANGQSISGLWPDVIVCLVNELYPVPMYINSIDSASSIVGYRPILNDAGSANFVYDRATGAFSALTNFSVSGWTSVDCATNAYSLPQLVANGRAYNIVNGSVAATASITDGTSAAPGIYFDADQDTGLYRPAANTIGFSTGGVERLRVDANGAVGIKTISVTAGSVLDLGSATGTAFSSMVVPKDTTANRPTTPVVGMLRYNTTTNSLESYQGSTATWTALGGGSAGALVLGDSATNTAPSRSGDLGTGLFSDTATTVSIATGGVQRLTVTATGSVGIGTATPTKMLEVTGDIAMSSITNALYLAGTKILHQPASDPTSYGFGSGTLASLTATNKHNVAIGQQALATTTGGNDNVAIGYQAMMYGGGSIYSSVAIGSNALAGGGGAESVAIGAQSMQSITSGYNNVAVGVAAAQSITTGRNNIAVGRQALNRIKTGENNVAIGGYAGAQYNAGGIVSGSNNTIMGHNAYSNTATSNGYNNTVLGYEVAKESLADGSRNILIGTSSAVSVPTPSTNDYLNIGNAIKLDMTAVTATNPIIHMPALDNTSIGLGLGSLQTQTATGLYNIAIGPYALNAITTGYSNIAVGSEALKVIGHGYANIAIGKSVLKDKVGGLGNIGIGDLVMSTHTNGSFNIGLGRASLARLKSAIGNVAVGDEALLNNLTGNGNTGIGHSSLFNLTSGIGNTAIGEYAGSKSWAVGGITSGSYNSILGSAVGSTTLSTGSSNILIGTSSAVDTPAADTSNWLNIGNTIYGDMASARVGIGSATINAGSSLDLSSRTDSILLPTGTEGQRPGTPVVGMLRYNTTSNALESYQGSTATWVALGATGSGAAGASGQSVFADWPDVIVCSKTGGYYALYHQINNTTNQLYFMGGTSNYLSYNTADGTYDAQQNMSDTDCFANTWSMAQLVASGRAYNIVNSSTSSAIAMDDGTSGAPGLYFGSDTNVGLYRPAADTIGISTGGVERLRVDANGAVGIKTISVTAGSVLDLGSATGTAYSSLIVPKDTMANRPTTPVVGMLRYNTTTNALESYQGSTATWTALGGGSAGALVLGDSATNTAPSRSGDLGTGLFSDTATTVSIATGGVQRLTVTATGATLTGNLNLSALTNALYISGTKILHHPNGDGTSIALGQNALGAFVAAGGGLIAIGQNALSLRTATNNVGQAVAIGHEALKATTDGTGSVAIGGLSLSRYNGPGSNTAIGWGSGYGITSGYNNTAVGNSAIYQGNTTGTTAIGAGALIAVSGANNTGVGNGVLRNLTVGEENVAVGVSAGAVWEGGGLTTGSRNTILGVRSLSNAAPVTGNNNVVLGYEVAKTTLLSGSSNILIGTSSAVTTPAAATSNYLNIGNTVFGDLTTGRVLLQGGATVSANTPTAGTVLDMGYATGTAYSSLIVPKDTTANRPTTPVVGMLRYNTTTNALESYQGSTATWTALGGGSAGALVLGDSATNTAPSRSGDLGTGLFSDTATTVSVATGGVQRLIVTATGSVGIGTADPSHALTVTGDIALSSITNALYIAGTKILHQPGNDTTSIALGPNALGVYSTTGGGIVAIGQNAFAARTASGSGGALGGVAIGYNALSSHPNGTGSVAIGGFALEKTTGAGWNTAIGWGAGRNITDRYSNVIVGDNAVYHHNVGGTTAIGSKALLTASANNNTAVGSSALQGVTTGASNTAIGSLAGGTSITTGSNNTVLGAYVASTTLSTGSYNILIGTTGSVDTPAADTSNYLNIGNAIKLDMTLVTATNPIISMPAVDTTSIGVGLYSLQSQTTTNKNNTALGSEALKSYTTAAFGGNTAVGNQAMKALTAGYSNTAVGATSLPALTTGLRNTAVGVNSLNLVSTGNGNVALGYNAGYYINRGNQNVAIGFQAMLGTYSGSGWLYGDNNIGIGPYALSGLIQSANQNVGVGYNAGLTVTTGASNLVLGAEVASTTLTTGSSNILMGTSSAVTTPAAATSNWLNIGNTIFGDLTTGRVLLQGGATVSANTPTAGTVLDMGYATGTAYSSLIVPKDTTANRPTTPVVGMLRYNTTTNSLESYQGSTATWTALGGGSSGALVLGDSATNTAPSRSGDLGTGLFSDTATTVSIATGGTQRLMVTATGSVGIGTATPSKALEVTGDIALSAITNALYLAGTKILHQPASDTLSVGVGPYALASQTATDRDNTALGYKALQLDTTGPQNTAVGYSALAATTTGYSNTAVGWNALKGVTRGFRNNALGAGALNTLTSGSNNIGIGYSAGYYITSGTNNVAIGESALQSTYSGSGWLSGSYNVAVGVGALSGVITTANRNTALGYNAGLIITTGASNLVLGPEVASTTLTTGSSNILIGTSSAVTTPAAATSNWLNIGNLIYGDMAGVRVGIGSATINAGASLDLSSRTDSLLLPTGTEGQRPATPAVGMVRYNTTTNALESYQGSTATWTAIGGSSALILGDSATNTAPSRSGDLGTGLFSDTATTVSIATGGTQRLTVTATGSVGIGTATPSHTLTVNGDIALPSITNAIYLSATRFISQPGSDGTSIAIGQAALASQTETKGNIGIGFKAGRDLTTGSNNTILGTSAGVLLSIANNNVALGYMAMNAGSGGGNIAIGPETLKYVTGGNNVAIGFNVGSNLYGASNNVLIGQSVAGWGATLRTGSNNILIGTSSAVDTPAAGTSNWLNIGNTIYADMSTKFVGFGTTSVSYPLQVGTSATNGAGAYLAAAGVWTNASDRRIKENIHALPYGTETLMKLKPVAYDMIGSGEKQIGFIAQEVGEVVPEVVSVNKEGRYGLSYGNLLAVSVKAQQEMKVANDNTVTRLAALEKENQELRAALQEVQAQGHGGTAVDEETRTTVRMILWVGGGLAIILTFGLAACGLALVRSRKKAA